MSVYYRISVVYFVRGFWAWSIGNEIRSTDTAVYMAIRNISRHVCILNVEFELHMCSTKHRVMRVQMGWWSVTPCISNLGTGCRRMVSSVTWLSSTETASDDRGVRLGGSHIRLGVPEKWETRDPCPESNRAPRFLQQVSRCTEWAISSPSVAHILISALWPILNTGNCYRTDRLSLCLCFIQKSRCRVQWIFNVSYFQIIWMRIFFAHTDSGIVVKALCYKPEGRGFEIQWVQSIFSIYLILAAALGPGGLFSRWQRWEPEAENMFLASKGLPMGKAHNLTAIWEPIV
jgi:hypothetical protein